MKVNHLLFAISATIGASISVSAATYEYALPSSNLQAPVVIGAFQKSNSASNIPTSSVISSDNFMGNLQEGDSVVKVFSFKHSVSKPVSNISAAVSNSGSNYISSRVSCTPPATLNSAVANEICDLYITYSADVATLEPEYFSIKVTGYASSTEIVQETFTFSASVGSIDPEPTGSAHIIFQKTGQDITIGALDIGTYDKYTPSNPTRLVTVTNEGDADANDVVVNLEGDTSKFSIADSDCGSILPVYQSCSFNITFNPSTSDPVDSYFSSLAVSYSNAEGAANESSAVVGYIVDSTPPSGNGLVFVSTATDPNPEVFNFNYSDETSSKIITIKNESASPISGVVPKIDYPGATLNGFEIQYSDSINTCGVRGDVIDYAYDEATGTYSFVFGPDTPVTLAPQQTCTFLVTYKPEQPEGGQTATGTLFATSSSATINATLSGLVPNIPGKLVFDSSTPGWNPQSQNFNFVFDLNEYYNSGKSDSVAIRNTVESNHTITLKNVGSTPVTNVRVALPTPTSIVKKFDGYTDTLASSDFVIYPVSNTEWGECGTYSGSVNYYGENEPAVPASYATIPPYSSCTFTFAWHPKSLNNSTAGATAFQVTSADGNIQAAVNIQMTGEQVSALAAPEIIFLHGWTEPNGDRKANVYINVVNTGVDSFLPSAISVGNPSMWSAVSLNYSLANEGTYGDYLYESNNICFTPASFATYISQHQTYNWNNYQGLSSTILNSTIWNNSHNFISFRDTNFWNYINFQSSCLIPATITINNPSASNFFTFDVSISAVNAAGTPISTSTTVNGQWLPGISRFDADGS